MTTQTQSSWFERNPKKTITVIIIIGLMLFDILAANILMALDLYTPPQKQETYYRKKHPVYHHTLAPNISYTNARWGPIKYTIHTNSLGFKDSSPRTIALQSNKNRILFIGDSFTEGVGVEYKNTFTGIVADKLAGKNIEILNASATSYSPIIYLRKTEHLIKDIGLKFDHLVVFIDISDIHDDGSIYSFDENRNVIDVNDAYYEARKRRWDKRLKRFLSNNTILFAHLRIWHSYLKDIYDKKRKGADKGINEYRSMWTVDEKLYEEYGRKGLANASMHMDELLQLLKKNDIDLTVAVYPWPDQIISRDLKSKQVLFWKEWTDRNNVPFINLFPAFINKTDPKQVISENFIFGDVHWNEKGHRLIAERLLPKLNQILNRE